MKQKRSSHHILFFQTKPLITALLLILLSSCGMHEDVPIEEMEIPESLPPSEENEPLQITLEVHDDGQILNFGKNDYYRYGPSIIQYEDGSMDLWVSSPGNSKTQWDWIRYRHSDDGVTWSEEKIVLKPTPGSKDQCSVCDPSVIFFDGFYYLAYTSTDSYELKGYNNHAFAARSADPDGPFEKWNGSGWGGDPEPILVYEGDPEGWGIGEPCLVIKDDDLFIYYTYADKSGVYVELSKADLVENWPSTIRYKCRALNREHQDSLDAAYSEELNMFLGFSMDLKMSEGSSLAVYVSENGKQFEQYDTTKSNIEDYAHSVGVVKSPEGHICASKNILFGYAYGQKWGRWDFILKHLDIIH